MARLILLRHAATADTGRRLSGRLPGIALSPEGCRQAAALARSLAGAHIDAVFTSPLARCRQTATAVATPHRLRPAVLHGLIEVDYGDWSGRRLGSVHRTSLWRTVLQAPSRARFPGGESLPEVQARSVAACEALAAAHPGATLAVVTHGDIIASALAHYLGMPLDFYWRLMVGPASASTLDLERGRPPRVLSVNLAPGGE